MLDTKNVKSKAGEFLTYHQEETKLIRQANDLLMAYSNETTSENLDKLNGALPSIRDKITVQTDAQAAIIGEYAASGVEEVRKAFLDSVLAKNTDDLRPLFDKLLSQTTLAEDVDEKFKYRFLSYVLQSSKFITGEGRFRELMGLLGDRQFVVDKINYTGPKAGLADPDTDNPKSEKTNPRDKVADAKLLKTSGGNLTEFIKAKRTLNEPRTPNPKRAEIGNVTVIMDNSQKLLPVYYGLTGAKEVLAYTSPLFTAIHHELGHVVNSLKGQGGRKADKYTADEGELLWLTDQEELQNISLDQYCDKAFTDELGLPERIAHGAYTSLDYATPVLKEQFLLEDMKKWDQKTYKLDELRSALLQKIRSVASKDWTPYTVNESKPAGVQKISGVLNSLKTTRKGVLEQLTQVRSLAKESQENPSKTRTKTTSKFYEVVTAMKFGSPEDLIAADNALAGAWPLSPSKDPQPSVWTKEEVERVQASAARTDVRTEFPRLPGE